MTADACDPLHPEWLEALAVPAAYPHSVARIERLETHLSWVFLTGDWVYKFKKPLHFDFVDFSTLEKRKAACDDELRLNQRTAAELYVEVMPLVMTADGPRLGASGEILEFAVRMRQFPQSHLLLNLTREGRLTDDMVKDLSRELSRLHTSAARATVAMGYATPAGIATDVEQCFTVIETAPISSASEQCLAGLRATMTVESRRLEMAFEERRRQGAIRECHGDLHLGNLVLVDGIPKPFDCLEFNPSLRWIDVASDLAFLIMDLIDHDEPSRAWRLLNAWLEQTGDFSVVAVFRYYLVYRALVRAKVAAIRLAQPDTDRGATQRDLEGYLALAGRLSRPVLHGLVLMHGLSGSGKSTAAQRISSDLGAIHLRSDVERKRLFGIWPPSDKSGADLPLYTEGANQATYSRLAELVTGIVTSGWVVIVDAASLRRSDRARFRGLADNLGVPFAIVACEAPDQVIEQRLFDRQARGTDASDAGLEVVKLQKTTAEPFSDDELAAIVRMNTAIDSSWPATIATLRERLSISGIT